MPQELSPSLAASESQLALALKMSRVPMHWFWGAPNHALALVGGIAAVVLALQNGMTLELHLVVICRPKENSYALRRRQVQ
jgi:hypothetical protein